MIRKYTEIFCWKNIRILCIESAKTVNEMTLNEFVKLTTLWTLGPEVRYSQYHLIYEVSTKSIDLRWWYCMIEWKPFFVKQRQSKIKRFYPLTIPNHSPLNKIHQKLLSLKAEIKCWRLDRYSRRKHNILTLSCGRVKQHEKNNSYTLILLILRTIPLIYSCRYIMNPPTGS